MSTINKISDTNQPVPEGLREAIKKALTVYAQDDLSVDWLVDQLFALRSSGLSAQPAPVAVGGERPVWQKDDNAGTFIERLNDYITQLEDEIDVLRGAIPKTVSVPPAAETGTGTPRTDGMEIVIAGESAVLGNRYRSWADFARTLERENAQLRASCDKWLDAEHEARAQLSQAVSQRDEAKACWDSGNQVIISIRRELAAARAELEEAKRECGAFVLAERKVYDDKIRALSASIEEHGKDKERLDWLEKNLHFHGLENDGAGELARWGFYERAKMEGWKSARERIDAARLSQGKQEGGVTE